jgi:hypothetical protein
MKARIELAIEELVLRGYPYAQRQQIAAAIQQELARLMGAGDLPESLAEGGRIPQLDLEDAGGSLQAGPDAIGARIASQVYANLGSSPPQAEKPG